MKTAAVVVAAIAALVLVHSATAGCAGPKGDKLCQDEMGPASYCKYWQTPAVCHGAGGEKFHCSCSPVCPIGDRYCQHVNHDKASYCKYWQTPAVCKGGDQHCFCGAKDAVAHNATAPEL